MLGTIPFPDLGTISRPVPGFFAIQQNKNCNTEPDANLLIRGSVLPHELSVNGTNPPVIPRLRSNTSGKPVHVGTNPYELGLCFLFSCFRACMRLCLCLCVWILKHFLLFLRAPFIPPVLKTLKTSKRCRCLYLILGSGLHFWPCSCLFFEFHPASLCRAGLLS